MPCREVVPGTFQRGANAQGKRTGPATGGLGVEDSGRRRSYGDGRVRDDRGGALMEFITPLADGGTSQRTPPAQSLLLQDPPTLTSFTGVGTAVDQSIEARSVTSRRSFKDTPTSVSGETAFSEIFSAPSQGSSGSVGSIPGGNEIKENIQKAGGVRASSRSNEEIQADVAYASGPEPPFGNTDHPHELDFEGVENPSAVTATGRPCRCVAQDSGCGSSVSINVGLYNRIPRWFCGQILKYVICGETFPPQGQATSAASRLREAIAMWQNTGVTFEEADRGDKASFRVVYRKMDPNEPYLLANAFLPNDDPNIENRTLSIYELAFDEKYIDNLANILAHEIGHILGLRHEFSVAEEKLWSTIYGKSNKDSVMNYYDDWSKCLVQQQDLIDLRSFYHDSMIIYDKKPVVKLCAPREVYP